jgi:hypothetical protein
LQSIQTAPSSHCPVVSLPVILPPHCLAASCIPIITLPPTFTPYSQSYTEGGRTLFHMNSQTPNPYTQEGGRTPGWGLSARTPNPYASANTSSGSGSGSGWAVQCPLGEVRHRSHPLGTRVHPRQLTTGGLVQHHRHQNRLHQRLLSVLRLQRLRLLPVDQGTEQRYTMLKRQWECLPVVLICPQRPRLHICHMSGMS